MTMDESLDKLGIRQHICLFQDDELVMPTCPYCSNKMEIRQIKPGFGLITTGLKFVCPMCGQEE